MHKPHTTSKYKKENTRRIGEGGTGDVYTARNTLTGEKVIIKQVKISSLDEGLAISGLRESCILSTCRHENVVKILETYYWQKNITLVLELCEKDIGAALGGGYTIPAKFRQPIFLMVLRGLHYLHSKWILHRDIKLSNILIAFDGTIKLADFGLSRYYRCNGFDTGNVGTQTYRAPEIILKARQSVPTSDVWSLGICFCEMIFGCDGSVYTFYDMVTYELNTMADDSGCKSKRVGSAKDLSAYIPKSHGDVRDTTMLTTLIRALGYPSKKERDDLPQTAILNSILPMDSCVDEQHASKPLVLILEKHGASKEEIDLILNMLNWSPYMRYTSEQCILHPFFASILAKMQINRTERLEDQLVQDCPAIDRHKLSEFPRNNPLTLRQAVTKPISMPCLNATKAPVRDMDDFSQLHTTITDVQRGDLSFSFLFGASMVAEGSNTPYGMRSEFEKQDANGFPKKRHPDDWDGSDDASELKGSKKHRVRKHEHEKDDPILLNMVRSISFCCPEDCMQNSIRSYAPFGCSRKVQQQSISQSTTSIANSWDDNC